MGKKLMDKVICGFTVRFYKNVALSIFGVVVFFIVAYWTGDIAKIREDEVGIVHKWWGGVQEEVLDDGRSYYLVRSILYILDKRK